MVKAYKISSQANLVLNPSFEVINNCNNLSASLNEAVYWNDLQGLCGAGLYNTCLTYTFTHGVPVHYDGGNPSFQYPKTGNGYIGNHFFTPPPNQVLTNYRGYVIGILNEILINNKSYCGKFYINLSNNSPYKINQISMYIDDGSIIGMQATCNTIPNVSPQVNNNPSIMLDDTLNWMRIEGVFTANGTENRVTIGNFKSDANTIGIATGFQTTLIPAFYNIDDVSIIAMDITAYAGNDATLCVGDSLHLGRPQEVGLECLWYEQGNSTAFASTSDVWFKPTQAGTYNLVQRMDNCAITWDTVHLTVIEPCNLEPTIPNVFTPNGDGVNDVFEFTVGKGVKDISFTVYNRWGLILTPTLSKGEGANGITQILWDGRTTSGIECSAGVYFYVLEYKDAKGDIKKKNGYISLIR